MPLQWHACTSLMSIIHASSSDRLSGTQRWVSDRLDEQVKIALLLDQKENNMSFSLGLKMVKKPFQKASTGCRPVVLLFAGSDVETC